MEAEIRSQWGLRGVRGYIWRRFGVPSRVQSRPSSKSRVAIEIGVVEVVVRWILLRRGRLGWLRRWDVERVGRRFIGRGDSIAEGVGEGSVGFLLWRCIVIGMGVLCCDDGCVGAIVGALGFRLGEVGRWMADDHLN
jgi:hypothetical protein